MKTRSYLKLAAMGVFALGVAFTSTSANAQTVFETGTAETINITANVQNAITATVVEPNIGNLGVIAGTVVGDVAELTIDPDGTIDVSASIDGTSRIVNDGAAIPGSVTVAAGDAFNDTGVFVTYSTIVDLTCATCPVGNEDLLLTNILDDLSSAPGAGCPATTAVNGSLAAPATAVVGCGTTSPTGELAFNIGYTITTVAGNAVRPDYADGAYAGSFDMVVEY